MIILLSIHCEFEKNYITEKKILIKDQFCEEFSENVKKMKELRAERKEFVKVLINNQSFSD